MMQFKCFAFFEVESGEKLGPKGLERDLMRDIVQRLRDTGLECTPPKVRVLSVGACCTVEGVPIAITLLAGKRLSSDRVLCPLGCTNEVAGWRKLIQSDPFDFRYSGKALEHVCAELADILNADPRINRVEWMTPEEWHKRASVEAKEPGNPDSLEGWVLHKSRRGRRARPGTPADGRH